MPVGDYTKDEIRRLALEKKLPVAGKPDSQDICFVPDGDYGSFIKDTVPDKIKGPGNFVSEEGAVLGTHKGLIHYTVGQRKRLGLSLGHPVFVSELRADTNEVVISDRDVFATGLTCNQINFMGMENLKEPRRLFARVRYAHQGQWCRAYQTKEDEIYVSFEQPVRAVTPGQAVVFYDGEYVMGGGTIIQAQRDGAGIR